MADFSNSNVDSRYNAHSDSEEEPFLRFIVVGKKCHQNEALLKAIQDFDAEVEISDTGFEFMNDVEDNDTCTIFVMDNFEGDIYTRLHRAHCRIVGPPVVIKCSQNNQRLPKNSRPLYCTVMHELVLCFTGFRVKEDLSRLADLVHHMGGSIRKDISKNVTHLVANSTKGEKYSLAISFGLSIMTEEWIHQCWENRESINLRADDGPMLQYKVSPFYFCVITTFGFTKEEERDIENQVVQYGGSYVEVGAPSATHLVVSSSVHELEADVHPGVHVVTDEWIWESVMLSACARESQYRWKDQGKFKTPGTPGTPRTNSATPKTMSGSKSRKRKKLKENLAQLASEGEVDTPMYKRRSSEMGHQSCGQSFLDVTPDVSAAVVLQDKTLNRENSVGSTSPMGSVNSVKENPVKWSSRRNTIMELFQTEKNYVGILHTILKVFKEEIEKSDNRGGPILDPTDVKMIFSKIPPIYDAHMKIRDNLNELINEWDESCLVGDIFVKQAEQLLKAYPPFVNFFETIKESIKNCDKTKPRFHAFLKICQNKPECCRQSLTDLLIRLVQRLPSVILLLKEIHKKTETSHPDKERLEKAISSVEEVMLHINEDKRRTECHQMMFELYNDIENIPADLLSSSRTLLKKVDVVEISDVMQGRGENATIFLLSDQIEMCKRRVKVLNSKSPGGHMGSKTPQKAYKHCVQVPFNQVKRVLNIKDTPECKNIFGLITKEGQELEKLYAFTIVEENIKKDEFLQMICKEVAAYKFRVDHESLLAVVDATTIDLQLDFTDLGASKILGKAAARFGKRVSRAFSFKQTPRKLRRAISTMVTQSPLNRRDSTASISSMTMNTPGSSGLSRGNRMASCNDLANYKEKLPMVFSYNDYETLKKDQPCDEPHSLKKHVDNELSSCPESENHVKYSDKTARLVMPRPRSYSSKTKRCYYKNLNEQDTVEFVPGVKHGHVIGRIEKVTIVGNTDVFGSPDLGSSSEHNIKNQDAWLLSSNGDCSEICDTTGVFGSNEVFGSPDLCSSPNLSSKKDNSRLVSFHINDESFEQEFKYDTTSVENCTGPNESVFKKHFEASLLEGMTSYNQPSLKRCGSLMDICGSKKAKCNIARKLADDLMNCESQDEEEEVKVAMSVLSKVKSRKRRSSPFFSSDHDIVDTNIRTKINSTSLTSFIREEHSCSMDKNNVITKVKSSPFKSVAMNIKKKAVALGVSPLKTNINTLCKKMQQGEEAALKLIRDSPLKKVCHGTVKCTRELKEKFLLFSKHDDVIDEDTSAFVENKENESDLGRDLASCDQNNKWLSPPNEYLDRLSNRSLFRESSRWVSPPTDDMSINERDVFQNPRCELDEISIGSSLAPSFTSEINMASNHTSADSWRRETLANGSSSLQTTPLKVLFPKKAATISSGTSKKYF